MFCCKSKDDGASPVKKSKKMAATPLKIEQSEQAGIKIIPLEAASMDPNGPSKDGVTADNSLNEQAQAPLSGAGDPAQYVALNTEQTQQAEEHIKIQDAEPARIEVQEESKEEGKLEEGASYEQLEKEKDDFKEKIMKADAPGFNQTGSPTAKAYKQEFLLSKRDLAFIQKGSPKIRKLPKLADLNVRTMIDTKALGQFWKGEANLYYDDQHILSIEQLKGFVRSGDLILKSLEDNEDGIVKKTLGPLGIPTSFYKPSEKLIEDLSKMKEIYLKAAADQHNQMLQKYGGVQ